MNDQRVRGKTSNRGNTGPYEVSVGECWNWVARGSLSCDGGDGLRLDTTMSYKKMGKSDLGDASAHGVFRRRYYRREQGR